MKTEVFPAADADSTAVLLASSRSRGNIRAIGESTDSDHAGGFLNWAGEAVFSRLIDADDGASSSVVAASSGRGGSITIGIKRPSREESRTRIAKSKTGTTSSSTMPLTALVLSLVVAAVCGLLSNHVSVPSAYAFQHVATVHHARWARCQHRLQHQLHDALGNAEGTIQQLSPSSVDFQSLFVMDVVLFRRRGSNAKLEMGAVQENGNVAPLSTWTLEAAYTSSADVEMMEFVVDEEDLFPGLSADDADVRKVLDGSDIGYGSRQVGGGKGPGNPHGEESELLYYVDRDVVEGTYSVASEGDGTGLAIEVVVNPNLEHLW